MIDLDEWITELDEEPDQELADYEAYQKQLFEDYVLRKNDNQEKRKELLKRYQTGAPLTGEKGLRKELAAFDLGYFGRTRLSVFGVALFANTAAILAQIRVKIILSRLMRSVDEL